MGFLLQALDRLLPDPQPPLVFEIGDGTLWGARRSGQSIEAIAERSFPLPPEQDSDGALGAALQSAVEEILPKLAPLPSADVAVLLPDHETRMAVFELERLPRRPQELRRTVEERFSNSLPFDARDARIAYRAQGGPRRPSVLATAASAMQVRQCESAFEAAGLVPGYVGLSTATVLQLVEAGPMTVLVKLGGDALTIVAVEDGVVRLVRRIALAIPASAEAKDAVDEVLADLFPTIVYIEENLRTPVSRLLLCGFGDLLEPALEIIRSEVQVSVESLLGADGRGESLASGLLGYVHG